MLYTPVTKKALKLCFEAHAGQVDKSGLPYVHHPLHVAEQMETEDETCVALLHDVMEDTDYTEEDLRAIGISEEALEALCLLTHDDAVPYLEYIEALKDSPLARKVKLADLRHNSDLSRLDTITDADLERVAKYEKARSILENAAR